MNYYSLKQALEVFKKDLPEPLLPFDLPQIADLCRQGKLTPIFPYHLYISKPCWHEEDGRPRYAPSDTQKFDGYLTHDHLISLIDGYTDSLSITNAAANAGDSMDILLFDSHQRDPEDTTPHPFTVRLENIRLTADDVQSYITLQYFDDLTTPEQQRITELESEIAALKEQLSKQTDAPVDDKELSTRSQNLAAKVILALLDTAQLDRSSPPYQYDNPSSNNSIIHDQLKAKGMKVSPQKNRSLARSCNQTNNR